MMEFTSPLNILLQAILLRYLRYVEKIPFGIFLIGFDHKVPIFYVKFWLFIL